MLAQIITENGQKKIKPLTADAGAGLPVGTIIVVCSNRVPSNYLPLGTQFDTTQYPLLYAELGTDTTPTASSLNLPTLSSGQYVIKATSGLTEGQQDDVANIINGERSYSTTEINTGKKWIDGKPIYRIVTTATKNQQVDTTAYKDTGAPLPSNVDKYILIRSTQNTANAFYYSTTNVTLYIAAVTTMNALSGTNYILEYTKTTD